MRVVFVNPPNVAFCNADLAPPLWALILGAVAAQEEVDARIVDLNVEVLENPQLGDARLYDWVTSKILQDDPQVVCFSSMAVNTHVSLEIARRLKERAPEVCTVLGGPHCGAIGKELIERYHWVDVVVQGEAEISFRALLRQLKACRQLADEPIAGVTYRGRHEDIVSLPAQIVNPADVPQPAYELVDMERYFRLNPRRVLDFDGASRGCIFACRYCYAPQHFGQSNRHPTTERFLQELARARETGAKHLFVVQDNFVNRPAETVALLQRMTAAQLGITFHCYSTLAQLTDEVIENLAAAGCRAVYVGVDAVHDDARRDFAKAIYRSETDLQRKIVKLQAAGIAPTLAFLLREPDVSRDEIEITIAVALAARIQGCSIRFNSLTLYPGTPAYLTHTGPFVPDPHTVRLTLDLPEAVYENRFADDAPHLFPFHATHRDSACQSRFQLGVHCLFTLATVFPKELLTLSRAGRAWQLIDQLVADQNVAVECRRTVAERRRDHAEGFLQAVRGARATRSTMVGPSASRVDPNLFSLTPSQVP